MYRIIAISLAALLGTWTSAAMAQAPSAARPADPAREPDVRLAEVISRPGPALTEPLYPKAARQAGISGRVEIECVIGLDTRLTDCKVLSEEPAGYDMGEAALSIAPLFRVRPTEIDGRPRGDGTIVLPFTFQSEPPLTPGGSPAAEASPRPLVRSEIVLAWPGLFAAALLGAMAWAWLAPPGGPRARRSKRRVAA